MNTLIFAVLVRQAKQSKFPHFPQAQALSQMRRASRVVRWQAVRFDVYRARIMNNGYIQTHARAAIMWSAGHDDLYDGLLAMHDKEKALKFADIAITAARKIQCESPNCVQCQNATCATVPCEFCQSPVHCCDDCANRRAREVTNAESALDVDIAEGILCPNCAGEIIEF